MAPIRILVVDDHGIVREGLKMVLGLEEDFEVVGEAASGREAVARAASLRPDVVLMDVLMDEVNGIDACRQIKNALPQTRVLMLTSHDAAQAVEAAVLAGASGYLLKNGGRDDLLRGVRAVARGESLLSPGVTAQVLERLAVLTRKERAREEDLLSDREKEVLVLVARGLTNRQIAAELIISENTVRNHLSHILDKLDLSRRAQVAAYAAQRGMLGQENDASAD
jgi:two-component system, NarL family, response regulator DevR